MPALPAFATVVVPTYNERENLESLVRMILEQGHEIRVLVVDDNSPDGTGALADRLAAEEPRLTILHRRKKQGIGRAYLAGFHCALAQGATYIIEMDADFSHDPADLPRLLDPVRSGRADLVLGSRWTDGGGTRNWPLDRRLISKGGSLYARSILQLDVRDLTGGFKCFNRRVLEALDLDGVRSNGYAFQIELTYRALRAGFRVVEIPIVFTERALGSSKMSRQIALEAMAMVWRLRFAR
ncbi:MAG: polyprenol monophosphomannose synthase [Dehalococcoidia bacterium]